MSLLAIIIFLFCLKTPHNPHASKSMATCVRFSNGSACWRTQVVYGMRGCWFSKAVRESHLMGQPWEGCVPQGGAEMYADAAKRTREMSLKHPVFPTSSPNEPIILFSAYFALHGKPGIAFSSLFHGCTDSHSCLPNSCSLEFFLLVST